MKPPEYNDIVLAQAVVQRYLPKTPLLKLQSVSEALGCEYWAKCENFHPVGAFKVRGGVNLVSRLSDAEKRAGVVSASTGNHGQSIAFAGRIFGVRVVIYSPEVNVNPLKLEAMRRLGAEVRLYGRNFDEAREEVERVAVREGLRYVHSANEPDLIAGVGTMGLEILDDLPDAEVILVPVGAGSSACGIGIVAKTHGRQVQVNRQVPVIGVQSQQAPAIWNAWKTRDLRPHPSMDTVHEGLATRVPFDLTTKILWDVLDDFVLVDDAEIDAAIRILAERAHLVAEGAGAASLAAAMRIRDRLQGRKVVGVISGGNIPLERLSAILTAKSTNIAN